MERLNGAVVVGYDRSRESLAAVDWAARVAGRRKVPLYVAHASPGGTGGLAQEGVERAREVLDTIEVHALPLALRPTAAFTQLSEEAGLIVLGHRGRGRITGALLGSVAFAVSAHASCPVAIVRGNITELPGPGRPVVVGTDGSDDGWRAVAHAAEVADSLGAELMITTAWQRPELDPWAPGYLANPNATHEWTKEAEDAAVQVVVEARDRVAAKYPQLEVQGGVQEGRAEDVLADLSHDAALVVVGARGRNELVSLLLGSTSRALLHKTQCPVQVIR